MRRLGFLIVALLALSTAGCRDDVVVHVRTEEQAPLKLGLALNGDEDEVRAQYAPLARWLGDKLAREVVLAPDSSYRAVGWSLQQGRVDLAWLSGTAFRAAGGGTALATAVRGGSTTYRGVILVKSTAAIRTVKDLAGKRMAYVDRSSGSGYLATNLMLLSAGLSPGVDLAATTFTYSHLESLRALDAGECDAAGVFENAPQAYAPRVDPTHFRVLATSGPLPNDVLAASPALDAATATRIAKLVCGLAGDPQASAVLRALDPSGRMDGFVAAPVGNPPSRP